MKYYSAIMTDANYWTKEIDAEGYLTQLATYMRITL